MWCLDSCSSSSYESEYDIPPPPPSDCSDSCDGSVSISLYEREMSVSLNDQSGNDQRSTGYDESSTSCSIDHSYGFTHFSLGRGRDDPGGDFNSSTCPYDLSLHESGRDDVSVVSHSQKIDSDETAAKLVSLQRVARSFALRCSFDHWGRASRVKCGANETETNMAASTMVDSDLQQDTVRKMGYLMQVGIKRMAFSILMHKVECMKNYKRGCITILRTFETKLLRAFFASWVNKNQRVNALIVHSQNAKRRSLKRVVGCWRRLARDRKSRRKKAFLTIILNRWKLLTDECTAIRQAKLTALMHWALKMCAKAFMAWKSHAENRRAKHPYTALGRCFENCRGSTKITHSHALTNITTLPPFRISYRSPETPMIFNSTPDHEARLTNNNDSARSNCLNSPTFGQPSELRFGWSRGGTIPNRSGFPSSANTSRKTFTGCARPLSEPCRHHYRLNRESPIHSTSHSNQSMNEPVAQPFTSGTHSVDTTIGKNSSTQPTRISTIKDVATLLDDMVSTIECNSIAHKTMYG